MKAYLLLRTLPKSMENIVDNLQSKADLTYNDVRTRLLDLNVSTNASASADALFVKKHQKDRENRGNNSRGGSNSGNRGSDTQKEKRKGIPPKDECSYCWKRSLLSSSKIRVN